MHLYDNNVSSLNLSNNRELTTICIDDNKINELDLKNNTKLILLTAEGNSINNIVLPDINHTGYVIADKNFLDNKSNYTYLTGPQYECLTKYYNSKTHTYNEKIQGTLINDIYKNNNDEYVKCTNSDIKTNPETGINNKIVIGIILLLVVTGTYIYIKNNNNNNQSMSNN